MKKRLRRKEVEDTELNIKVKKKQENLRKNDTIQLIISSNLESRFIK